MKNKKFYFLTWLVLVTFVLGIVSPLQAAPVSMSTSDDDGTFSIPASLGSIDSFDPGTPNKPTIFHIQDAHGILSAQESIQGLIAFLQAQTPVAFVALEGASSPLDVDLLRSYPEPAALEKVLWSRVERGEVSGAEMQAVLGSRLPYRGLEDRDVYEQSLGLFRAAQKATRQNQVSLELANVRLRELSQKHFSKDLGQLVQLRQAFKNEEISMNAFIHALRSLGLSSSDQYPQLSGLLDILEREERISSDSALSQKLSSWINSEVREYPEAGRLKQDLATSRITLGDAIRELQKTKDIATLSQGDLDLLQHVPSQSELSALSGVGVFKELDQWLDEKERSLVESKMEKFLLEQIHLLDLTKRLASLELSSSDWNRVSQNRQKLEAGSFQKAFKQLGFSLKLSWDLQPAVAFYGLAEKRDQILAENLHTLTAFQAGPEDSIILVTGGFHQSGIEKILKNAGYPYCVISPYFRSSGPNPYLQVMMGNASYQSQVRAALSAPVTSEERSTYRIPMLRQLSRELAVTPRITLDWKNRLLDQWSRGRTSSDISRPLKELVVIANSLGASGNGKKSGTQILAPPVLNTGTVQQDVFNFLQVLVSEDGGYDVGRGIVLLADNEYVKGFMSAESGFIPESGTYPAVTDEMIGLDMILKDKYEIWKLKGQERNLTPLERIAKGYDVFLATDLGLVSTVANAAHLSLKDGKQPPPYFSLKRTLVGDTSDELVNGVLRPRRAIETGELIDPWLHSFERQEIPLPDEFILVPMTYNNELVGVLYLDDVGKSGSAGFNPERMGKIKVFTQAAAKSIVASRKAEESRYRNSHDTLTDLWNLSGLQDRFLDTILSTIKSQKKISIIAVDFDKLHDANEKVGHAGANLFFQEIAKSMKALVRPEASPARVGGDEFVIILPDTNTHNAWETAERIRKKVSTIRIQKRGIDPNFGITVSTGIATYSAVKLLDDYVALIPSTHDDLAAKITTHLSEDLSRKKQKQEAPVLGEVELSVGGESHTIFLFNAKRHNSLSLRDQVSAIQQKIYDVTTNDADIALYVSKQKRNMSTVFSVEARRKREAADPEELIKAFRGFPLAAHRLDRNAMVVDVTDEWLKLLGYTREEVVGREIFSFLPYKDRQKAKANHFQRMGMREMIPSDVKPGPIGGQNKYLTRPYVRKDGSEVIVASTHQVNSNKKGEMTGVTTTLQEASIIELLRNFAALMDLAQLAIDSEGVIGVATKKLAKRLGYGRADELVGLRLESLFPEGERNKLEDFLKATRGKAFDSDAMLSAAALEKTAEENSQAILKISINTYNGAPVEIAILKGYFRNLVLLTLVDETSLAVGRSLGSAEDTNSLRQLNVLNVALKTLETEENQDLWAAQFFGITGALPVELESAAARTLSGKAITPYFFGSSSPVAASNFLVLDLKSLLMDLGDSTILSRMAETAGENGKIFPVYRDRKDFERFRVWIQKLDPELRSRFLKPEGISGGLMPEKLALLRKASGLEKASLGFLVSDENLLMEGYASLVPQDKEVLAFRFAAERNHSVLARAIYSIAFSAFADGSQALERLDSSLLKRDQKSGISLFSFDLTALAALLTQEWRARTEILQAA